MKNLLFVNSSLSGSDSRSVQIARELIAGIQGAPGSVRIVERELGEGTIPHLTAEHLHAIATAAVHRDHRQQALAKLSDTLIGEVEAADMIVIAAPMYNFTIPSTLKAWLDHITRAGRTFRYTAEGRVEGLLKGKKVYIVVSRGGVYTGDSPAKLLDFQEPYLRAMLGFNGLTDVTVVHVEGQKISPAVAEAGLVRAREFDRGYRAARSHCLNIRRQERFASDRKTLWPGLLELVSAERGDIVRGQFEPFSARAFFRKAAVPIGLDTLGNIGIDQVDQFRFRGQRSLEKPDPPVHFFAAADFV